MKQTVKVVEEKNGKIKRVSVSKKGEVISEFGVTKKGEVMDSNGSKIGKICRLKGRWFDNNFAIKYY